MEQNLKEISEYYKNSIYEVLCAEVSYTILSKVHYCEKGHCIVAKAHIKYFDNAYKQSVLQGMIMAMNYDKDVIASLKTATDDKLKDYVFVVDKDSRVILFYECF